MYKSLVGIMETLNIYVKDAWIQIKIKKMEEHMLNALNKKFAN